MSDTNSEIVWYIAREGEQHGPLSDAEMRLFVDNGHLRPNDLVWNPEMPDWQPATTIFPPKAKAAPPPPPPPPPATAAPTAATKAPRPTDPAPQSGQPSQNASQSDLRTTGSFPSLTQATAAASAGATPNSDAGARPGTGETTTDTGSKASPMDGVPSPDDVLPSFRSSRSPEGPQTAPAGRQPLEADAYDDDDDDNAAPKRGSRAGLLVGTFAVAAAIAGGGVVAFQNSDAILSYMNQQSAPEATPVVKAKPQAEQKEQILSNSEGWVDPRSPQAREKSAAPKPQANLSPKLDGITVTIPPATGNATATAPPASEGVPLDTIDRNLQKSQLWQVVKKEFPDWYKTRVEEISTLSGSASETDLSRHLIGKLVSLRRENAKYALSSSTEHLQNIADAFLANLRSLAGHSTEACYTFISRGETSPDVISLFPKPGYGDAIEGQIAAVFRAVANGRETPIDRTKAGKPDYDVLAQELTKIGWSKEDLGLFANPQALAKAPPERVCKMVQDWFAAHVSISDTAVKERLLVETLRPVVAG